MTLEARCRNCGNTGYDMFHRLCPCKVGKTIAQMAAAGLGNAPFPVDAFKTASDAASTGETVMADETNVLDEAIHQLRARCLLFLDNAEHWTPDTEWSGRDLRMIVDYLATCVARDEIHDTTPQPRAIIQAFAAAMERKLAANDHKRSWKKVHWFQLYRRMVEEKAELLNALDELDKVLAKLGAFDDRFEQGELLSRLDADEDVLLHELDAAKTNVLLEAADVSNYAMFVADVCGALPATDERGREVR